MNHLSKPFLLIALSFLFIITACYNPVIQKTHTSIKQSGTTSGCRVIQHRLGETCIPLKPQRIIALDIPGIVDPLLSLDIKPVGMVNDFWGKGRYFTAVLPEKVAGIESLGTESIPSLEKILMLKPDLILMADYAEQNYKQLSMIAPTVLIDIYKVNAGVKENFQYIAKLVGQEEKSREVLKQHHKRIAEFQNRLDKRLKGKEVSVIAYYNGAFWQPPISDEIFKFLKSIGLNIKSVFMEKDEWSMFSLEVIDQYDADILFIIDNPKTAISYLSQEPLILSLKAVKNRQAYIVSPKAWTFHGPIGMDLFLDDISKYLLKGKQDPSFSRRG